MRLHNDTHSAPCVICGSRTYMVCLDCTLRFCGTIGGGICVYPGIQKDETV